MAPTSPEAEPGAHCVQAAAPLVLEKEPIGQDEQAALELPPGLGLYVPGGQRAHDTALSAPATEPKDPAGHG